MDKNDVNKLAQLRQFVIDEYGKLADPNSISTMIKEQEMGRVLVVVIRSLEDLMKGHVKFEGR